MQFVQFVGKMETDVFRRDTEKEIMLERVCLCFFEDFYGQTVSNRKVGESRASGLSNVQWFGLLCSAVM